MRLLLTITSEEKHQLGHRARYEFDHTGGTIGRNAACAWALPDPTNMLSSRHATIAYNGRGFEITDTSTNGVYVNAVDAPIGRGNTAILTAGDILYLGSFVLSVEILEESTEERRRLGVGQNAVALKADRGASSSPRPAAPFAPAAARSDPFDFAREPASGPSFDAYAPSPNPLPASRPDFEMRATEASVDALFGKAPQATPAPSTTPRPMPPSAPSPALPAIAATGGSPIPASFGSPTSAQATASAPGRAVIPHDILADILGVPGQKTGSSPGALPPAPNAPGAGADLLGSGSPSPAFGAAPRKTSIIPDTLDFGDLLSAPLSKLQAEPPGDAPRRDPAPSAFATPFPDFSDLAPPAPSSPNDAPPRDFPPSAPFALATPATPFPDPRGLGARAPTAAAPPEPSVSSDAPVQRLDQAASPRPALSAALMADMVSLRPPGAAEEAIGQQALDPVAVLRQRAAAGPGTIGPRPLASAFEGAAPAAPPSPNNIEPFPTPRPRQAPSSAAQPPSANIPLAQPSANRAVESQRQDQTSQGSLVEAFWNGLGLDPTQIPPQLQAEILTECGRALREAVTGLVPVLSARRSLKDELRMDQTRLQPKENNPLKFLPSGEAVLQALVERKLAGFLPLSQAVREGFNDIKAHEVAAIVALDAVIKNLLARFDPASMDAQGPTTKLFGRGPDKTKLWDNFTRLHAALSDNLEETTRKVVGEEFARAYAQQVESSRHGGN